MGHYGISKSVSVMLYSMLSNIMAEYKFKTYDKPQTPLGEQIFQSQKLLYYNLDSASVFSIEDIAKSILHQCSSEIRAGELTNFLNFRDESSKQTIYLKRHY